MNEDEEKIYNVQFSINEILGVKTGIRRKKVTKDNFDRDSFTQIIENIEMLYHRSFAVETGLGIILASYDESFFETIDMLLEMNYNYEQLQVINFYLYGRYNEDGTINTLVDEETNDIMILYTPIDLWNVIKELK